VVIHLSAAGLDNVDILSADRLLNFHARLADCEFPKQYFGWGYAKVVADGFDQLRVGAASQDNQITNHCRVQEQQRFTD